MWVCKAPLGYMKRKSFVCECDHKLSMPLVHSLFAKKKNKNKHVNCTNKIRRIGRNAENQQQKTILKTDQNSQCELIVCLLSRLITLFIFLCVFMCAMHRAYGITIRSPLHHYSTREIVNQFKLQSSRKSDFGYKENNHLIFHQRMCIQWTEWHTSQIKNDYTQWVFCVCVCVCRVAAWYFVFRYVCVKHLTHICLYIMHMR